MARRRSNRIDYQFDPRPIEMLESVAFRAASRACRLVLDRIAVECAHHGGNDNGKLPVTYDHFVEFGLHRHAIGPAIREGEALGLFFVTEHGRANAGEFRSPNKFRLSYRYAGTEPPTNEWRRITTLKEAKRIARAARRSPPAPRVRLRPLKCPAIAQRTATLDPGRST